MEYNYQEIEEKWQQEWKKTGAYKVSNISEKPKYYVLDMFPYPSGAGLHVGHPLGYIASDIYSRYKRLKGYNVLHPMGFDSFGLPAEQYALETGQHPVETTRKNIATFKAQLDKIGFCYDWDREVRTSDPSYYKWTQWIFLEIFNSYFDKKEKKAKPITELIKRFETEGNQFTIHHSPFTSVEWQSFDYKKQQEILMEYRLAFSKYGEVNWCEALGTVLANDEVVNGVSERGGYPVVKKKMRQWYLRITEYADRLLEGLESVDFSDSMKEMQRNWIGKSQGAEIAFRISPSIPSFLPGGEKGSPVQQAQQNPTADAILNSIKNTSSNLVDNSNSSDLSTENSHASPVEAPLAPRGEGQGVRVYTTRPDTIFGVDFMVVAPELELVQQIKSAAQSTAVDEYIAYVKSRSDIDRMAEKKITGCFTGAYAINPFDGKQIPIWISEYVLAGYGTGAIMAVPCGDERDFKFAKHFNIPITNIIGSYFNGEEANATKEAILENSGFLNGMKMMDASEAVLQKLEAEGIGKRKVNYRMRDAGFSRQRYWGEPFPIIWSDGVAIPLDAAELPLELPHVAKYEPGPEGEGPLANILTWKEKQLETSTMPGYAGSSWYFLRYMDPHNGNTFCDRKASDYWNQVDLYIGGTEHAVGHLLYSRLWTKVLFDLGYIGYDEPFKKLLNQGMITGVSEFMKGHVFKDNEGNYKHEGMATSIFYLNSDGLLDMHPISQYGKFARRIFYSTDIAEEINEQHKKETNQNEILLSDIRIDIRFVDNHKLNLDAFISQDKHYEDCIFVMKDGFALGKKFYTFQDNDTNAKVDFFTTPLVEKMSKSKKNVVNPDELCEKYGADTFRMYEMFLGPVEQSKPWDTKGIEGVYRFLKKLWRLFYDDNKGLIITNDAANAAELKVLHKTIKKIEDDTERYSFNTAVSGFMIAVNELADLKCHKREILEPLVIMLTPYAPHIAEELYHALGNTTSVLDAAFPIYNAAYTTESSKEYPVSINGKLRTTMQVSLEALQPEVEAMVMANELVQKWMEGKEVKKFIFVKGKMINVVV